MYYMSYEFLFQHTSVNMQLFIDIRSVSLSMRNQNRKVYLIDIYVMYQAMKV